MSYFIFIVVLIAVILVWCLFISTNQALGKVIYEANNSYEIRSAGLELVNKQSNEDKYVYFANNQLNKPTMLLLHGFSADKTIWLKFAKHASLDYNLIIPDLLGHGDVPYSESQNYSAFEQAAYVSRLLEHICVDGPITIAGNSMGGMIAGILGKNSKEGTFSFELNKLVLIDPAGAKSDLAVYVQQSGFNPFSHKNIDDSMAFYKLVMNKPPFIPPSVQAYIANANYLSKSKQYQHMFTDFFNPSEFFDTPFETAAKEILLIWGNEDNVLPVNEALLWEKLIDCKSIIIPDIGHMSMVECPEYTYSLIHQSTIT
jgi:pimeloyl-ACP methyl ester carboxylesterase